MSKKNSLTEEEIQIMYQTRDEWINRFNSLPRIDTEKLEKGIYWLYNLCGFSKPKITILPDPLSAQIYINIKKNKDTINDTMWNTVWDTVRNTVWDTVRDTVEDTVRNTVWNTVRNTVWDTVRNTVRDTVEDTVRNTVWNTVWDTVWDTVWNTVRDTVEDTVWNTVRNTVRDTVEDTVWDTVWNTVRDTVEDTVWNTVRDTVEDTVRNTVWNTVRDTVEDTVRDTVWNTVRNTVWDKIKFYPFDFYGGVWSYGWVSFYSYFRKIGIVNDLNFSLFEDFLKSGAFMVVYFENEAVVIENPVEIKRDSQQRIHCTTGPAVIFSNGLGINYIHGRETPSKFFGEITEEMFLQETNENYRAAMYEILGDEKLCNLLGAEVVHEKEFKYLIEHKEQIKEEKETLQLIKTRETFSEIDNQPFTWVKYICPSTGSSYLISCEPHFVDVEEAAKSLLDFELEPNESYYWNSHS